MRRRQALKVVKELDAFSKVPEDYVKPTTRGGLFSVVAISTIIILVVSEISYYRDSEIVYEYSVDTDMNSQLKLFFDITIAMPCEYLGADVVDAAGASKSLAHEVHKEAAVFELTDSQQEWLKSKQKFIKQFEGTRALKDVLFDSDVNHQKPFPNRNDVHAITPNSCRIHGHIEVNKVAGNFHITAGQAVPHPQGHAHLNAFVPSHLVNFSHRIDRFGFGISTPGNIDPLEGTYIIAKNRNHLFQYYLQIVPTSLELRTGFMSTNQYSVTERNRTIDHTAGSHGLPGLFFKYDIYSMMVKIREVDRPFLMFLVRLCATVGGVFVTLGMISQFLGYLLSLLKREEAPLST